MCSAGGRVLSAPAPVAEPSLCIAGCLLQPLTPWPPASPHSGTLQHHVLASPCCSRDHPGPHGPTSPSAPSTSACSPVSPTHAVWDVPGDTGCSGSLCFITSTGTGSQERRLAEGLMSGEKEWIRCARQGGGSASPCLMDGGECGPSLGNLPFAGTRSQPNPRLLSSGWGLGVSQGWLQQAPRELESHESH